MSYLSYQDHIILGTEIIKFSVLSMSRRTMEIAVHPDKSVVAKVPTGTSKQEIQFRMSKNALWIRNQIEFFKQFETRTPERQYLGGETHLYLGRQYRLKISSSLINDIKLSRGFIHISTKEGNCSDQIKWIINQWYLDRSKFHFVQLLERCWPKFERQGFAKPKLQIRKMKKRWGSLSKNGILTLNSDLIRAPKECIEYVIVHELCHLKFQNHGTGFQRLLERTLPDWKKRKKRLELSLL